MRKHIFLVLSFAIIVVVVKYFIIFNPNHEVLKTVPSKVYFNLTDEKLKEYKKNAELGDITSCIRLMNYYSVVKNDEINSRYWLQRAADFGDVPSQHYLSAEKRAQKGGAP